MLTIRQWLTKNAGEYASKSECLKACATDLGVSPRSVRDAWGKLGLSGSKPKPKSGDRISDFRQEFDRSYIIPQKVHKVIKTWLSREDVIWASDADMQQRCGIPSSSDWKHFARENAEFECFIFKANGKSLWARDEETRDTLQRMALRR